MITIIILGIVILAGIGFIVAIAQFEFENWQRSKKTPDELWIEYLIERSRDAKIV